MPSFNINVNENDVPVMGPITESFTINEGGILNLPVSATDNNGTAKMAWTFTGLPSFATFTLIITEQEQLSLGLHRRFPASGLRRVRIILSDGYGAWTSEGKHSNQCC